MSATDTAHEGLAIDRILSNAGMSWRRSLPPPPEAAFADLKPPAFGVLGGAAIGLAIAGLFVAGAAFTLTRLSEPRTGGGTEAVRPGDRVEAHGTFVAAPGGSPVICRPLDSLDTGAEARTPPTCSPISVRIEGVDVRSLLTWGETRAGTFFVDSVRITGSWTGEAIVVDAIEPVPIESDYGTIPCDPPPTGWPPGPTSPLETEDATASLADAVQGDPARFSGYWGVTDPSGGTDGRALDVLVVGVRGDMDAARGDLEAVYPYALCLVSVRFSESELEKAARDLARDRASELTWAPRVDVELNRVRVRIKIVDDSWAALLAERPEIHPDALVRRSDQEGSA